MARSRIRNRIRRKNGSDRERIDFEEVRNLSESGVLISDRQRRRTLWFDGRFLQAKELTQDQDYFLARQRELGRSGGSGVATGLMVELDEGNAAALRIQQGHGVTPSGELVTLLESMDLDLSDIEVSAELDTSFGLDLAPRGPARTRTGLFVLALRPVEFTANPIASYPSEPLQERRRLQLGDIIEAAAVTLIPFPDRGGSTELDERRAQAARRIFVEPADSGLPSDALPLAMVALDRGFIRWLDVFMVRREMGVEHGDVLGASLVPRATSDAFVLQNQVHLEEVFEDREERGRSLAFAAADHFLALPPVGRVPKAAIDMQRGRQVYFPPSIEIHVNIVPQDEMLVLMDEAHSLPPIDLTAKDDDQLTTVVDLILPLNRVDFIRAAEGFSDLTSPLKPPAAIKLLRRSRLQSLYAYRRLPVDPIAFVGDFNALSDPLFAELWEKAGDAVWYVRRRNIHQERIKHLPEGESPERVGEPVDLSVDPQAVLDQCLAQLEACRNGLEETCLQRWEQLKTAHTRFLDELADEAEGSCFSYLLARGVRESFLSPIEGDPASADECSELINFYATNLSQAVNFLIEGELEQCDLLLERFLDWYREYTGINGQKALLRLDARGRKIAVNASAVRKPMAVSSSIVAEAPAADAKLSALEMEVMRARMRVGVLEQRLGLEQGRAEAVFDEVLLEESVFEQMRSELSSQKRKATTLERRAEAAAEKEI